ncbi:unnamed protein product [Amoebophrya sp. A120]|nr:unnamed protein product [Amoebophrya sp. A120]|eukprot:GSA120T00004971001.1
MAEKVIIRMLEQGPLSAKELTAKSEMGSEDVISGVNLLLKQHRIAVIKTQEGSKFRLVNEDTSNRLKTLTPEQKSVYQFIMEAKDHGIQTKDLQRKTSLPLQHVKNICLKLKEKQMVKDIKPVHSKRTAVWMGWHVTPAKDISGGLWYVNGELQEKQIELLKAKAKEVLSTRPNRGFTVEEVCEYAGVSGEVQKMSQILRVLQLDRVVDATTSLDLGVATDALPNAEDPAEEHVGFGEDFGFFGGGSSAPAASSATVLSSHMQADAAAGAGIVIRYRIRKQHALYSFDAMRDIPCLRCKVRDQCDASAIFSNSTPNPTNCQYLTRWLYTTPGDESEEEEEDADEDVDMEDMVLPS